LIFRLSKWAALACAAALAGCGGDGGPKTRGDAAGGAVRPNAAGSDGAASSAERGAGAGHTPEKRDFRVATYNAGLAVGVLKYAQERVSPLVRALADQKVDLLCVQEFWLEEHWDSLAAEVRDSLPNTFRLPPERVTASCEAREVEPVVACATASCSGRPLHELAYCMLRSCGRALEGLSPDCFQCLAANPQKSPAELARACMPAGSPEAGARRAGGPKRAGGPEDFRVYSGSFGTGILTNAEIVERDSLVLPSVLDRRAVLYTKLATPVGKLHAFCTHLTANLGSVPHPGRGSFQRDQEAQVDALLAFVERKAGSEAAVVLGDLNTGPAVAPHISAALPGHYDRLLRRGFLNPYASQEDVKCTYCFDNPLEGGRGTRGVLIDHVLLRGFEGRVAGDQMMRPMITVEHEGRPIQSGYSDHYGVIVTLSSSGS
jgi:endonuclease/exonuclease/phosphatase family metal-dependent hydrolase